jgi:hypothetical protein
MRLERYLTEKYISAVKVRGDTYDIFKNPKSDELKEVLNSGYGLRIIIDVPKKNIYFASGDIMHRHMLQSPELKKDIPIAGNWWSTYWDSGEGADDIFMFDVDNRMTSLNSDSLYNLLYIGDDDTKALNRDRIDTLLDNDFKWLKKYNLNPLEVQGYIKTFRRKLG